MSQLSRPEHSTDLNQPRSEQRLMPWFAPSLAFYFTVSRTEVTLQDGQAHVKAERHHVEDGRVVTERIEGRVDPGVYYEMIQTAERQMHAMLELILQPMKLIMPWLPGPRR